MDNFIKTVQEHKLVSAKSGSRLCLTGGGAQKFGKLVEQILKKPVGQTAQKSCHMNEFASLVRGIDFMREVDSREVYFLSSFDFKAPIQKEAYGRLTYPYLVVNIGTGVSIISVDSACPLSSEPQTHSQQWFRRVGGSAIGGGTFYGLCRALTGCQSFEEALSLAAEGKAANVNLLVKDIYGGDFEEFNLPADTGALANLYAKQVQVPQILFCGNFLTNNNEVALRTLAHACNYWSKGQACALFLRHEGYLGALGSLL